MKKIFFTLTFCALSALLFADTTQESIQDATSSPARSETISSDSTNQDTVSPNKSNEVLMSEEEERRDIINYGLETDILSLIKELSKNEDASMNDALASIFPTTALSAVRIAILEFFASQKVSSIDADVMKMLENMDDYSKAEVNALISFVGELKLSDATAFLSSIIKEKRSDYLENAIIALGKVGSKDELLSLVETYENIGEDDEKKQVILKEAILKSLQENAPEEAFDFLCEVAEEEAENVVVRSLAVSALSSIKTTEVFSKLLQYYSSSEPLLRVASIKGIAEHDNEEAKKIMLEATKDSYYKVRAQAIKSIALNDTTVNYLVYRAKKDPEQSIRLASIERLSESNNSKANEYLISTFNNEKTANSIRVKIAETLLKNNFELIIADVEKVAIESTKDDKNKALRMELGRILAKIKNERTATIAEAYLRHKDTFVKSLGLDMFAANKYSSIVPLIEEIANNEKMGALQKRAKSLLQ